MRSQEHNSTCPLTGRWNEYNEPWLKEAISRDDEIIMATDPTVPSNLMRVNKDTGLTELNGFGREYGYLKGNGYSFYNVSKKW
jgi:hypothetical protein